MILNPIQALAKFLIKAEVPQDLVNDFIGQYPDPSQDQLQELINEKEIDDPDEIMEIMYDLDQAGIQDLRKPKPAEIKDWTKTATKELAKKLDIDYDSLEIDYSEGDDYFKLEGDTGSNGESEWEVYIGIEEAEESARDHILENILHDRESIGEELIVKFTKINNAWIENYAREDAESLMSDMSDDEVLEEARQLGEEEYDDAEKAREDLISDRAESTAKEMVADPLTYFKNRYGDSEGLQMFWDAGNLDKDALAEYVVENDGAANTLDSYDGEAVELPSGAVAFGTN